MSTVEFDELPSGMSEYNYFCYLTNENQNSEIVASSRSFEDRVNSLNGNELLNSLEDCQSAFNDLSQGDGRAHDTLMFSKKEEYACLDLRFDSIFGILL